MEKPWLKSYDPHLLGQIQFPEILLPQILDDAAARFPERIAIFFFGGKLKYGELRSQADWFARSLRGMGFKRGDPLGILLPNMPQAVIGTFGALKAGGSAVFFDPLGDPERLRRQLHHAGVETLVLLGLLYPRIEPILSQTKVRNLIVAQVKEYLPFPHNYLFSLAARGHGLNVRIPKRPDIRSFQDFLVGTQPELQGSVPAEGNPEDTAFIQYQSGPSGDPRGILFSHRSIIAGLNQISSWLGEMERGREVFLSVIPSHRIEGLTLTMSLPIFLAAASVQMPQFEVNRVLTMIRKHRVSVLPVTPPMTEAIGNYLLVEERHVSSIKACFSVGEGLTDDLAKNFERRTARKMIGTYGPMPAGMLTHAHPARGIGREGSIGLPLPGTEAMIVDPSQSDKKMPVGRVGELVIRGPQLLKGFSAMPEETRRWIREGWLHTGEMAKMDEDGFFYVVGKV
jgi:long-chain acyl-CoA synthetase